MPSCLSVFFFLPPPLLCMCVCLSVSLSLSAFVCVSFTLFFFFFMCVCQSFCLSLCFYISDPLFLSLYLSRSLSSLPLSISFSLFPPSIYLVLSLFPLYLPLSLSREWTHTLSPSSKFKGIEMKTLICRADNFLLKNSSECFEWIEATK